MFGVKVTLPCFKQLPLNSNFILEIFIHNSFGERLLFAVKGGVINNPLDSHSATVFDGSENVVTVL